MMQTVVFDTKPYNREPLQHASAGLSMEWRFMDSRLFTETAASSTPNTAAPGSDGFGTLAQGYVETSNVNVVEELVAMIQTQRAYEINSKAIQTSDQMLQRLGQL